VRIERGTTEPHRRLATALPPGARE
jgi:hypothetical protein